MSAFKEWAVVTLRDFRNALSDRPPIVLANGVRTVNYQVWRLKFGLKPAVKGGAEEADERFVTTTKPITYEELKEDR